MTKTHTISTFIGLAAAAAFCGCLPGASLDEDALLKTASFDHDCPPEKIQIVTVDDGGMDATGRYLLEVCGNKKKYKRMGTKYYDAETGLMVGGSKIAD